MRMKLSAGFQALQPMTKPHRRGCGCASLKARLSVPISEELETLQTSILSQEGTSTPGLLEVLKRKRNIEYEV
jgi:hypothetical protein